MPIPVEFTADAVKVKSEQARQIPYKQFFHSGEPFRSMHRSNPWLKAPDFKKPLECPLYDAGRGTEGGGLEGTSSYWDTTVGRKHKYWKEFDLPKETKDIDQMRHDLMEWGYCLIEEGMSKEQCAYMRDRLEEQAEAERECGVADMTPFFHIMWTLVNKGDCFAKCVEFDPEWVQAGPLIEQLNEELLGKGNYALSFASNIAKPHCYPQMLHQDSGQIHPIQTPDWPILVNTVYIMQDVNEVNGGTLVIPGSHRTISSSMGQPIPKLPPAINIEARGGTVFMMDGRLLHGTGVNHTDNWRYIMTQSNVKPWLRQQENWMLSVAPEVLQSASPKLLARMGFNTSGLLEVQAYSGMKETVATRLALDEGKYTRIGVLKRPVSKEQRESLTVWQMKQQMQARRAGKVAAAKL
mmetsp:Transcript_133789/g.286126  ORF Transcript_133789/g.286126 Transcript_133789/m.286126 type:complete len:409 (-) Transcript_133789:159-1385(-)